MAISISHSISTLISPITHANGLADLATRLPAGLPAAFAVVRRMLFWPAWPVDLRELSGLDAAGTRMRPILGSQNGRRLSRNGRRLSRSFKVAFGINAAIDGIKIRGMAGGIRDALLTLLLVSKRLLLASKLRQCTVVGL
ncbi:uncharacterized protein TRIVIDRAFT_111469 [Trichoderma virens Gv29-8]|uniref:Uncharacterized protein n=1 Tax=Hypocrea virens (strain Gv29-8 / FGSC 10586) TaxID=413071 RepID=G9N8A6_HYPVG|nr:uncharacterized protein TRIVIDRAFT_111469 [Trichoderma virens Gv29-8]EHK17215.1 hypothetical protein TRIVIDRAFT_111469 [Trichoderma virens Gv29-8]